MVDHERNERERIAWSSAAPGWERHDEKLTKLGEPVGEAMIQRGAIAPGQRVLDLASGSGEPALRIAALGAEVLGTDIAEPLLELARRRARARGLTKVEFQTIAAEDLTVPAEIFDRVVCRWGVMFMANPTRALERARAALRPGGRIVLAAWGPPAENPFISVPLGALRANIDLPAPQPDAPGVFAFANPQRLGTTLHEAGFREVDVASFPFSITVFASGEEAWQFTREIAPPIAQLYDAQPPATRERIDAAVADGLSRFRSEGGLSIPAATWIAVGAKG